MTDTSAIKPSFNIKAFVAEEKIKNRPLTEEEKELYSLTSHNGWIQFSRYVDQVLKELDETTDTTIASGVPFEEIGRNVVVINLAKDIIKRVMNHVNDARDCVQEQIDNEK
jgi:hypothetical protein